jgi:hypothetical protein
MRNREAATLLRTWDKQRALFQLFGKGSCKLAEGTKERKAVSKRWALLKRGGEVGIKKKKIN